MQNRERIWEGEWGVGGPGPPGGHPQEIGMRAKR